MKGLFKIRKRYPWGNEDDKPLVVYDVIRYENRLMETVFLVYDKGDWCYVDSRRYEPVEEER